MGEDRQFKFDGYVYNCMSQLLGNKPSVKGAWSGLRDQFTNFTPHEITLERLKLQTSDFVHSLATRSTNLQMTNCPLSGRGQGHVTHSRISHPQLSLEALKLESSNFVCLQAVLNVSPRTVDHP